MFDFLKNAPAKTAMTLDQAADLLGTNPETLAAFDAAYSAKALGDTTTPDNFFELNSRQASQMLRESQEDAGVTPESLIERIIAELLAQTKVYAFDGDLALPDRVETPKALPAGTKMVAKEDINALPLPIRPQLSGELMKCDIPGETYLSVLNMYNRYKNGKTAKEREMGYNMFRQGLDILDLDSITYEIIATNPNSMGFWLPALVEACRGQEFLQIPATRIAKVPLTLLQLTRTEYNELTRTTLDIVDGWARDAFKLDEAKEYFVKTGCYSSKFDFRNAKVTSAKEVRELGEYLLFIHSQALQMASPLSTPSIYGASTTVEWVVRDYIKDKENCPCIYKGMPLHTEYRVFVDCDTKSIIGFSPYWEPNTMKRRFASGTKDGSVHDAHDYVIYKAREGFLMDTYRKNLPRVLEAVEAILPKLNLPGQWSLDIMQNGDDFWVIDMALAENSAFYGVVPPELRAPTKENWLPKIETPRSKNMQAGS